MNKCFVPIADGTICRDRIYFYINETNGLYAINMNTDEMFFLCEVPWGVPGKIEQYVSITSFLNQIVLIPYNEKNLVFYDVDNKDFRIEPVNYSYADRAGYMANCVVGDKLYIFETYNPIIVCYNYANRSITKITGFEKDPKYKRLNNDAFFRQQILVYNKRIYAPFCNADAILIIDTDTSDWNVVPLGDGECGYAGITVFLDRIWLLPRCLYGDIVSVDFEGQNVDRYSLKRKYSGIEGTFIGALGGDVLRLYSSTDIREESVNVIPAKVEGGAYGFVHQMEHESIVFSRSNNSISVYRNNEQIYCKEITLTYEGKNVSGLIKAGILMEGKVANLSDFIRTIAE